MDEKGNVVGIVSAKVLAHGHQRVGTLAASPDASGENVNYAIKSREGRHVAVPNFRDADTASLPVLESVPGVEARLKKSNAADEKFEDVVKQVQAATVLVLVY